MALFSGCQTAGPGTTSGGAFGTLAGTLTGAAIGATDGKATEGALIGAVAGGTLGAVAGNAVDNQVDAQRREIQNFQAQRQLATVSLTQIVQMKQSGLPSDLIANQIHSQGLERPATTDDLIYLKNQGVSNEVIQAVQTAPLATSIQPAYAIVEPPILQQPVVRAPIGIAGPPVIYHPVPPRRGYRAPRRPRPPRRPSPGVSIRF